MTLTGVQSNWFNTNYIKFPVVLTHTFYKTRPTNPSTEMTTLIRDSIKDDFQFQTQTIPDTLANN